MTAPLKPWETTLQNSGEILKSSNLPLTGPTRDPRSVPILPPRPQSMAYSNSYSSYSPYSSYGSIGGYGGAPYRSSMYGYNNYGSYGMGHGMYGMNGSYGSGYGLQDDSESRFVHYCEERSRNTFANVESVVRAFNSMAMMLDNTFFAMTSSFRAVLGVAENFGRLRSMFAQVWHALNVFRLLKWMYRKLMEMTTGRRVPPGSKTLAWTEALGGGPDSGAPGGSSWPTVAFFGALLSIPYLISKLLPKYEDKLNPENWKASGIPAKAAFDFIGTSNTELTVRTNDYVLIAPKSVQEEMKLTNTGWAFALCNQRTGVVPLNYLVIVKRTQQNKAAPSAEETPLRKKRVSFGENQIFEMKKEEETIDKEKGTSDGETMQ